MIWSWIRYILIIASAATLVLIFYQVRSVQSNYGRLEPLWPAFVFPAFLFLNLAYLMFARAKATTWLNQATRLSRLFTLWLDAKEAELRKRAGKSHNSN
jgi:hypothetical protein